jgi:hypothetical protein
LTTEDPNTVVAFANLTAGTDWVVQSTRVPRKADIDRSIVEFAQETGATNEMLFSLTNLDMALSCDAWVGSLNSHWGRVIDEMRSTVRCNADRPFVDVALEFPYYHSGF